jgi:hypothetical protein
MVQKLAKQWTLDYPPLPPDPPPKKRKEKNTVETFAMDIK